MSNVSRDPRSVLALHVTPSASVQSSVLTCLPPLLTVTAPLLVSDYVTVAGSPPMAWA